MTHCQVLGHDLIERMAADGIIANVQPSFTLTDAAWVKTRLSPSVQATSYCWRTLLEAGVHVAGGSDAPIETPNPLQGMSDAIFRSRTSDRHGAFLPDESLTFAQALHMYTKGAAFAAGQEGLLGSIEPGFLADMVVLNTTVDLTEEVHAATLPDVDVAKVVVAGIVRLDRGLPFSGDAKSAADTAVSQERPMEPKKAQSNTGPYALGKNGFMHVPLCQCCRPELYPSSAPSIPACSAVDTTRRSIASSSTADAID